MTEFVCNWGQRTITITILVVTLMLFISVKMLLSFLKGYKSDKKRPILVFIYAFIAILPLILTFAILPYMPLKVIVDKDTIYINQFKGGITIPIEDIVEIRRYTGEDSKNTVRTFGSGGLFGFLGKFKNPQIGKFEMFATDTKDRTLIKTNDKVYVISCANPNVFIETVKNNTP
jgi:Protein of unknown function (DUF2679).